MNNNNNKLLQIALNDKKEIVNIFDVETGDKCKCICHECKKPVIAKNKNKSLVLLNEKALNAAFKVPTLVDQKLIRKKEVNPINSHPKNNITKFPEETKKTILIINRFKKIIKRSTKGSYLK